MARGEFLAFAAEAVPPCAAGKVASGQWTRDEALELSRKSFKEHLPQGLATAGNYFFTILELAEEVSVGTVWIAIQDQAGRRLAYVYDLRIKPEHQRKGHATRALLALEEPRSFPWFVRHSAARVWPQCPRTRPLHQAWVSNDEH